MADLEINNQRQFFDKIVLDENGYVVVEFTAQAGDEVKPLNAREFYEQVALNEDGYLKLISVID